MKKHSIDKKRILFGVGAGTVSLGIDGIAGLLLYRLLARYLSPDIAGFWILVNTSGAMLLLLQCGLGPSVSRQVAIDSTNSNHQIINRTVATVHRASQLILIGVMIFSALLYIVQISSPAKYLKSSGDGLLAWIIYSLSIAINLSGQCSLFIMNGFGLVGWDKILRIFTSSITILASWWSLSIGYGILALAGIQLAASILFLIAARALLKYSHEAPKIIAYPDTKILKGLFRAGFNLAMLSVLGYAVTNIGLFVAERRFGLQVLTPYGAMLKIGALLSTLASLLPTMAYPYVAKAFASGDRSKCKKYYLHGIASSVTIYALLALPVYMFGSRIFELWLGSGKYLGDTTFGLILLFYAMFVHHISHSTPVLAVSGNTFFIPAVINAICVVALSLILPIYFGIDGIPIAMLLGSIGPSAYVVCVALKIFRVI
jgi:O-antigen/teichoic acid export membrane protein